MRRYAKESVVTGCEDKATAWRSDACSRQIRTDTVRRSYPLTSTHHQGDLVPRNP